MQVLFGTAAIDAEGWAYVLGFGAGLFLLVEAEKAVLRLRLRRRPPALHTGWRPIP
jgi:hypothetical protein